MEYAMTYRTLTTMAPGGGVETYQVPQNAEQARHVRTDGIRHDPLSAMTHDPLSVMIGLMASVMTPYPP